MKISKNDPSSLLQNVDSKKSTGLDGLKNDSSKAKAGGAGAGGLEKLDVSANARRMNKAMELALNAPDVRENRVQELQALIDSGKYKTDAKAIADKLVDDHLLYES